MARKIDFTFDSEKYTKKQYQLASGYISQTTILFEKENVTAVIQAKGDVEFYNMNDELIAAGNAPKDKSGRAVYEDVVCHAEENRIRLEFPIYEWIDNYPNCDGEHDRWDTRIIGHNTMTFDLTSGTII